MTRNPAPYITTFYSRHQVLVRRLPVSTASSLRSWAQLFLSLITETPTSLSSIISLPLTLPLWNFRFLLVFKSPATTILSKTKPLSVQRMPSAILSSFYWTPSGKNSWWMDSQLNKHAPLSWRKSDNGYNSAFTKGQSQLNNKYHHLSVLLQTLISDCHSSQRPSQPLPHYCRHFNNSPQQRLLEREWEVGTFRKINIY